MLNKLDKIFHLLGLCLASKFRFKFFYEERHLSDRETILLLKRFPKLGIVRYGNSELGLMVGNSIKHQVYSKKLKNKLVYICRSYNSISKNRFLLGLPLDACTINSTNTRNLNKRSWGKAVRFSLNFLVKKNITYVSPFCFRVSDVVDDNLENYISIVEDLFIDREVIYVGPLQGKNPNIPGFINAVDVLKIPEKNAFTEFDAILSQIKDLCLNYDNPLVVVVGGITATVLSYELNMSNITCYDFGQFARLHQKYKDKLN
jgi:hypothetical protein